MGRIHLSNSPKYIIKQEPVCEGEIFLRWGDQAFDPEAEILSGREMVYEAFMDPSAPDDGDASELGSDSSSSAATEDLDERSPSHRTTRERLGDRSSSAVFTRDVESTTNEFDDFVRVEVPPPDSPAIAPDVYPIRSSSTLRQSITNADLHEHPDPSEATPQPGDEERLFAYFQSPRPAQRERDRLQYGVRVVPRPWPPSSTRRVPGRSPLPNVSIVDAENQRATPRPRSASFSEVAASGGRIPERWLATMNGTVPSNQTLAARR